MDRLLLHRMVGRNGLIGSLKGGNICNFRHHAELT